MARHVPWVAYRGYSPEVYVPYTVLHFVEGKIPFNAIVARHDPTREYISITTGAFVRTINGLRFKHDDFGIDPTTILSVMRHI